MAPQLLFYERAVPISSENHREVTIEGRSDYAFARATNVVPLTTPEMATAAAEYAVVFVGQGDEVVPAALLGVRDQRNLFVDSHGRWDASYIPAFVRRYPFVFATGQDPKQLMLCIDEASPLINREGRGERLFDATGARTSYLDNVLTFMQRFQAAFQRSQQFARQLNQLGLLQPVQAQLRGPEGELSLRGFMRVDREKLNALDDATILQLFRSDALEVIHLHLASMRNLQKLGERALSGRDGAAAPTIGGDDFDNSDILIN
mgnify:CR=1 FL=1